MGAGHSTGAGFCSASIKFNIKLEVAGHGGNPGDLREGHKKAKEDERLKEEGGTSYLPIAIAIPVKTGQIRVPPTELL